MKRFSTICLIFALLVCILPASAVAVEDVPPIGIDDASVITGCNTIEGMQPLLGLQPPVSNAKAVVLYEVNTDTLLSAGNGDEPLPPSSLTKILTALIAIEKGSLTDAVTVKEEVLATLDPDAVVVKLAVDEVVTVEDLLYCLLVGSGNDAAVVLADHVMGSQQNFVVEMNRYALELGCTGTNFTNVHGLHDENQYTTARDMARILSRAIENEKFCEVFGAKYYTVPETNKSAERHLVTDNYLVNNDREITYYDARVTGSRTGTAFDRTRNIASVAEQDGMKIVCIVMGAKSQFYEDGYTVKVYGGYLETKELLEAGFNGLMGSQVIYPGQIIKQAGVLNGSCEVSVGTQTGAFSVVPDIAATGGLEYRFVNEIPLVAPIQKGQRVSTLQIWCGNICIAQTELYAMNSVAVAGTEFDENDGGQGAGFFKVVLYVLGIVLILVLAGFIGLLLLRFFRMAKVKRQSRRHRRNRRRSR